MIATTAEQARAGAEALEIEYAQEPHDVVLAADSPKLRTPEMVNGGYPGVTEQGDVEAELKVAEVVVDQTYTTQAEHSMPMEPNATVAYWDGDQLTVFDSNQGAYVVRLALAAAFGIAPTLIRVHSEHVGGGFGAKLFAKPQVILAALAAKAIDRPVRVAFTRRQMFSLVGYRTPTIQHVRLGATREGRLTAVEHVVSVQTSTVIEYVEQAGVYARTMYATDALHTQHKVAALDVPTPRWVRAPGEGPGSFGVECAMDELAEACGVDPVELRIRNEPDVEPVSGMPFGSRDIVTCFREGARLFGWQNRDPRPRRRRDGRWLIGTGVAAGSYPSDVAPSTASVTVEANGRYIVRISASDIGTGSRTALTQVAADELRVDIKDVRVLIGDSDFGPSILAGHSFGTTSWSWAIVKACQALRDHGSSPLVGLTVTAGTAEDLATQPAVARHSYAAQFAEVAVDPETGEIRVPRLLGYFDVGRVVNPITTRAQLIGGITMGMSKALFEEALLDRETGDFLNHNFGGYHVATNADVRSIEVGWLDIPDSHHPSGVKGLGEVGLVGVAAAIANAVRHATGVRHRSLPITPPKVLAAQPS